MGFDLNNYETVHERLVRWWNAYPDGQILTTITHYDGNAVVFRCEGLDGSGKIIATGYAEEIRGSSPVNKTSFLENAETSSVGRMIQNSPIAASKERPSREEMEKVARVTSGSGGMSTSSERSQTSSITTIGGLQVRTEKQAHYAKALGKKAGMEGQAFEEWIIELIGTPFEVMTIAQANQVIDRLKGMA